MNLTTLLAALAGRDHREPLLQKAGVVAAVTAACGVLVEFGVDVNSSAQSWVVRGVMFLATIGPIVAALRGRDHVTPLADPKNAAGVPLTPDVPAELGPLAPIGGAVAGVGVLADDTLDVAGDAVRGVTGVLGGLGGLLGRGRGERRKP